MDRRFWANAFEFDRPTSQKPLVHRKSVSSQAIFRLELSIELAKIATSLDQVLDAFYVTDRAGKKITDEARLESIQFELNNTLAEFDATGHQRFVG